MLRGRRGRGFDSLTEVRLVNWRRGASRDKGPRPLNRIVVAGGGGGPGPRPDRLDRIRGSMALSVKARADSMTNQARFPGPNALNLDKPKTRRS